MATKAGITQKIYVKKSGDTTHVYIAGETTSQVDYTNNPIDVSDKDSAWDKFISGNKSWQAAGSFMLDNSSTGEQKNMMAALMSGDTVDIFVGELSEAGAEASGMYGTAIITAISEKKDKNGALTRDITFKGTGAPVPVYPA